MAKPLRSQLNQIRAWVRQGRTDAWIAHQLEVPTTELREFRRRHELSADDDSGEEPDLRDEIEAEIEAATREEERAAELEAERKERERERQERERERLPRDEDEGGDEDADEDADEDEAKDKDGDEEPKPRRRRRRRGGRGRGRVGAGMQGSFDHGEADGYGLWLDPAIADDPVYSEHWAGHRKVEITVEPDRIVIKRAD